MAERAGSLIYDFERSSASSGELARNAQVVRDNLAFFLTPPQIDLSVSILRAAPYEVITEANNLGHRALAHVVGKHIRSSASAGGWSMTSPEIVYLSGAVVREHVQNRVVWMSSQIDLLRQGKRRYASDRETRQSLTRETRERAELRRIEATLRAGLGQLARDSFPDPRGYSQALDLIATIPGYNVAQSTKDRVRRESCKALAKGDAAGAIAVVEDAKL